MILNKFTISTLIFFLFTDFIFAETQSEKRNIFIEATASRSILIPNTNLHRIDSNIMDKNNNFSNRDEFIGEKTALYGSDEQKAASLYTFKNSPKPKLNSSAYSIFAEYLFNSNFGLGMSLNYINFKALDISGTRNIHNVQNSYLNAYLNNQEFRQNLIAEEIYLPYKTQSNNKFLQIYTFGLHIAYHFLKNNTFDPYIRVGFGYGRNIEDMTIIYQSTLALGTRFFFNDFSYFLIELNANNYDGYKVKDPFLFEAAKSNPSHIWSLQEYSAKIGLGLAI